MKKIARSYFNEDFEPRLSNLIYHTIVESVSSLRGTERHQYLSRVFLSKYCDETVVPADVRRERAVAKWLATEIRNEETNDRLLNFDSATQLWPGLTLGRFVTKVREIVASVIGVTLPESVLFGGFSSGASTSLRRERSHRARKFLGERHVTPDAYDIAIDAVRSSPVWASYLNSGELTLTPIQYNVLFTVPKNAEIDRCAAKEPDLNMYLQRGVGNHIRDCLRRHGVNLNDQSQNRRWAWKGSLPSGHSHRVSIATVDLSAASDSVTCSLVDLLLPDVIGSYMRQLRSPYTLLPDGTMHENEMFSSMGNGYTFELESLLFYSISRAVCYFGGHRGPISVYGDDIIIPASAYDHLTLALEFCGFLVNLDKSFATGPFRESCGGHYLDGIDVTPFYLRSPVRTVSDLIAFLNQLRAWSIRGCTDVSVSPDYSGSGYIFCALDELWKELAQYVDPRLFGGCDLGSRLQLVTPDRPRRRLAYRTISRDVGEGGYLAALLQTQDRAHLSVGITDNTHELLQQRECRLRRVSLHQWTHRFSYPFEG